MAAGRAFPVRTLGRRIHGAKQQARRARDTAGITFFVQGEVVKTTKARHWAPGSWRRRYLDKPRIRARTSERALIARPSRLDERRNWRRRRRQCWELLLVLVRWCWC